jgi:hypothetical protein
LYVLVVAALFFSYVTKPGFKVFRFPYGMNWNKGIIKKENYRNMENTQGGRHIVSMVAITTDEIYSFQKNQF